MAQDSKRPLRQNQAQSAKENQMQAARATYGQGQAQNIRQGQIRRQGQRQTPPRHGQRQMQSSRQSMRASPSQLPKKRRKKPRPRRDYTLFVLAIFANIGGLFKIAFMSFRATKHYRAISAFLAIAVLIVVVVLIFNAANRPNAIDIYFDDTPIGTLRIGQGRDITPEYIMAHATARLESQVGGSIRLYGQLTANPIRLAANNAGLSFDNIITALLSVADYYIYAAAIYIDGHRIALLPSSYLANSLLNEIAQGFVLDNAQMRYEFLEDVNIVSLYVHHLEVATLDEAKYALITPRPTPMVYTVLPNDSLYGIAAQVGMSISSLLANNPNIDPNEHLQIGQTLVVLNSSPILNVVTTETTTIEEEIPYTVELVQSTGIAVGSQQIIQQGQPGRRIITEDIVRINGNLSHSNAVSYQTIIEAIPEIVQIGIAN